MDTAWFLKIIEEYRSIVWFSSFLFIVGVFSWAAYFRFMHLEKEAERQQDSIETNSALSQRDQWD